MSPNPTKRPDDSCCTCHLTAPCAHCTWYADRGLDDPPESFPDHSPVSAAYLGGQPRRRGFVELTRVELVTS